MPHGSYGPAYEVAPLFKVRRRGEPCKQPSWGPKKAKLKLVHWGVPVYSSCIALSGK